MDDDAAAKDSEQSFSQQQPSVDKAMNEDELIATKRLALDQVEPKQEFDKPTKQQSPSWLANAWGSSGSWIQTAKDKTLSTIESMKKDLNEFSDTLQHEATVLASSTASSVKHQAQLIQQFVVTPDGEDLEAEEKKKAEEEREDLVQKRLNASYEEEELCYPSSLHAGTNEQEKKEAGSFFGAKWVKTIVETVQKLGIEDTTKEEDKFTEEIKVGMPRKSPLDQMQLLQIQNEERTFLQAPLLNTELYNDWLQDFNIGEYNGEINLLLGYNPKLRQIYSKLVPAKVDNHMFWNRYFFKVHILELDKEIAEKSKEESKLSGKNSSGAATEKDETWSMCSGTNNDLQDLEDDQFEDNTQPSARQDLGSLTPQPPED